MYGVARERARNRTMQISGLAVSALATAAAGYLMMNSFGSFVGAFVPESTTLATITPEKEAEPPPPEFNKPENEVKLSNTTVLTAPDETFTFVEEKKDTAITGTAGDEARTGGGAAAAVAPARTVRIAPKLRSMEKPPYPASEIRRRSEGSTGLKLCVDAHGRVTSASLASSSGHPRLDEEALKWVKSARFSPGTVDGAPQTVCAHTVVYEWRLEDIR
jgi:protein TonB